MPLCSVCHNELTQRAPVLSAAPVLCLEGGRQAEALHWSPVSRDVVATASSADSDLHLFDLGICDEDIPTTTLTGDPQVCPQFTHCIRRVAAGWTNAPLALLDLERTQWCRCACFAIFVGEVNDQGLTICPPLACRGRVRFFFLQCCDPQCAGVWLWWQGEHLLGSTLHVKRKFLPDATDTAAAHVGHTQRTPAPGCCFRTAVKWPASLASTRTERSGTPPRMHLCLCPATDVFAGGVCGRRNRRYSVLGSSGRAPHLRIFSPKPGAPLSCFLSKDRLGG